MIYSGCPRAFEAGIWWPQTKFGQPAAVPCPKGSVGECRGWDIHSRQETPGEARVSRENWLRQWNSCSGLRSLVQPSVGGNRGGNLGRAGAMAAHRAPETGELFPCSARGSLCRVGREPQLPFRGCRESAQLRAGVGCRWMCGHSADGGAGWCHGLAPALAP